MDKGEVEDLITPHIHCSDLFTDVGSQVLVGKFHEVGQGSRICIPVAPAIIFQQRDLKWRLRGGEAGDEEEKEKDRTLHGQWKIKMQR